MIIPLAVEHLICGEATKSSVLDFVGRKSAGSRERNGG